MKHEAIKAAWAARDKLHGEGYKLFAEGKKVRVEGKKVYAKLRAESRKLCVEGGKRCEEGDKLYRDAVTAKHGDKAVFDWETGEITIGEALIIMGEDE